MLQIIGFLSGCHRYSEWVLYRSGVETAKLETQSLQEALTSTNFRRYILYKHSINELHTGGTQMDPRYPTGKYTPLQEVTPALRQQAISAIAETPAKLRAAVRGLNDQQLNTPYREGGWTVRQLAHHVPDSHINAYVRLRLALTEQEPSIKPYEEARWAELEDAKSAPIDVSLALLDSLHERWVRLWRSLRPEDFARTFRHPDHGVRTVDWLLFLYAWHGRHHTAHVTELRKQKGW
jgi:uncharacterized damage-inducible protein DinB